MVSPYNIQKHEYTEESPLKMTLFLWNNNEIIVSVDALPSGVGKKKQFQVIMDSWHIWMPWPRTRWLTKDKNKFQKRVTLEYVKRL